MDQFVTGLVNAQGPFLTHIFRKHWQYMWRIGPSLIFFQVFAFLLSKIHPKLKNRWILEIFSNNKNFLSLIFVPNPFRVFISTYESFNFYIKIPKVGFCLFPPVGPLWLGIICQGYIRELFAEKVGKRTTYQLWTFVLMKPSLLTKLSSSAKRPYKILGLFYI